jgi:hypothetical protein
VPRASIQGVVTSAAAPASDSTNGPIMEWDALYRRTALGLRSPRRSLSKAPIKLMSGVNHANRIQGVVMMAATAPSARPMAPAATRAVAMDEPRVAVDPFAIEEMEVELVEVGEMEDVMHPWWLTV